MGAFLLCLACLVLLCHGLAARGFMKGDAFLTSTIGLVVGLVVVFVFWPVATVLSSAVRDEGGALAPAVFLAQAREPVDLGPRLPLRPAPVRRGLEHAVSRGPRGSRHDGPRPGLRPHRHPHRVSGQAPSARAVRAPDHHAAVRDRSRADPALRPVGRCPALLSDWFGIPRTRWIYGLPGVLIAQLLAFAPIAFLVLIGVVQGISPSLEEAAQTLRASRWTTFRTVTWPLLRPGARERVPAGLRGEPGRFRQSSGAVGQLRAPVHPDLLRRGGGGARSGPRGGARHRAARLHAGGVLRAAAVARSGGLHHGHREGGRRPSGAAPRAPPLGLLRARPAMGDPGARDLCRHHRRGVRTGHGAGLHADPRVLRDRVSASSARRRAASTSRDRRGTPSGPRSRSLPSRRRSPPRSAC